MTTTRTYLKGCDWCNAKGVIPNSNPAFCGNTSFTEICPVCNGNKTVTVTEVAEMPTEVTDDEIAAMALEFAPVCIYGDDDDREDVNGSIREDVTKLLKQLRNRMTSSEKPNNHTRGEG